MQQDDAGPAAPGAAPAAATAARPLSPHKPWGPFGLEALILKGEHSTLWQAVWLATREPLWLLVPRQAVPDPDEQARWMLVAQSGTRCVHPGLAPVTRSGLTGPWPYLCFAREGYTPLPLALGDSEALHPKDVIENWLPALEGLAYAHDAGLVYGHLESAHWVRDTQQKWRLMAWPAATAQRGAGPVDPEQDRQDKAQDVLSAGVLLHRLLLGQAVWRGQGLAATTQAVLQRQRILRLPMGPTSSVPEPLRRVLNRATDAEARLRPVNARSLAQQLHAWWGQHQEDPRQLLDRWLGRIGTVAVLPSLPEFSTRLAHALSQSGARSDALAKGLMHDTGFVLEMLRQVHVRLAGPQGGGRWGEKSTILTLRRALALTGTDGLQKTAAALKPWPGRLDEAGAARLKAALARMHLSGLCAQALRPAGYDAEVIYITTVLQHLADLLVHAHFPAEVVQMRELIKTQREDEARGEAPPSDDDTLWRLAAYAVLGVHLDQLGHGLMRQWDWGDVALHIMNPVETGHLPRKPDTDEDVLRTVASAGTELARAWTQSAARVGPALQRFTQRWGRALGLGPLSARDALNQVQAALKQGVWVDDLETPSWTDPSVDSGA